MIKNRFKITIKSLNQERIFNALSKKIDVFDLKKENGLTHFVIERKNKKFAKKFFKQNNIQVLSFQGTGLIEKLINVLKNYGVLFSLLIMSVLYPLQYSLVLKIVVLGEKTSLCGQIECYINEKLDSRLRWEIDTNKLEEMLRRDFTEISSVSAAIVGQSLVISVNQIQNPQEMQESPSALVSLYDCRIENIVLVQGTLAVKVGDVVRKGQVLVHPFIIDSQGQKRSCTPKAEINASVWVEGRDVCYDKQIVSKRTGRKALRRDVFLNNVLLYTSAETHDFSSYEEDVEFQEMTKNNLLPLKIKRTWIHETITEEVLTDFLLIKEQVIENARQKALIFLGKNEIIKEENYSIREGNGWHEVCFVLTVERNIGG